MGHNQNITIATWNACLGISNKKDLITNMINENKIDILCLQEVAIDQKIITNMMSIKNYNIEIEQNDVKSRAATYIKSTINYKRRCDLEGINDNMLNKIFSIQFNSIIQKLTNDICMKLAKMAF